MSGNLEVEICRLCSAVETTYSGSSIYSPPVNVLPHLMFSFIYYRCWISSI